MSMWSETFSTPRRTLLDRLLGREPHYVPAAHIEVRIRRVGDPRWHLPVMTDRNGKAEVDLPPGDYEGSAQGVTFSFSQP